MQRDQFAALADEHRAGELDLTSAFDGGSLKPATVDQNKEKAGATDLHALLET